MMEIDLCLCHSGPAGMCPELRNPVKEIHRGDFDPRHFVVFQLSPLEQIAFEAGAWNFTAMHLSFWEGRRLQPNEWRAIVTDRLRERNN
jgi:hypothetical protein